MIIRKIHNFDKETFINAKSNNKKKHSIKEKDNKTITYASKSEINASINFILKKYADTFRILAK